MWSSLASIPVADARAFSARRRAASTSCGSFRRTRAWSGVFVRSRRIVQTSREGLVARARNVSLPALFAATTRASNDPLRPRFVCGIAHEVAHRPFRGFNRAHGAVVEAAILVSRLHLLPREKIEAEMDYLRVDIDKTAGDAEREAWGWLAEVVERGSAGWATPRRGQRSAWPSSP